MSYVILPHVATGDLATAALHNTLLDDVAIQKTSILDDGRLSGEIQNWREDVGTLAISSNTITLDLSVKNVFKVSLIANITTITVSNWAASKATPVTLRLTQDGTGGRTVAFPAGWKWDGGATQVMPSTANHSMVVVLYSDDGGTTIFANTFVANAV